MIKLIVTDLDDTFLYDAEQKRTFMYTIPKNSLKALELLEQHDIKFAIATGRTFSETFELLKRYNLNTDIITNDGTVRFDGSNGDLKDVLEIDSEDVLAMMNYFNKLDLSVYVRDNRTFYGLNYQWGWLPGVIASNELQLTDVVVDYNSQEMLDVILKYLEKFPQYQTFVYPTNVVIKHPEGDKGQAILRYIAQIGIKPSEVIVVGDGVNDVPMFKRFKGCFMEHGNAMEAKALSYRIVRDFKQAAELVIKENQSK